MRTREIDGLRTEARHRNSSPASSPLELQFEFSGTRSLGFMI
jgi:hypothetical protein